MRMAAARTTPAIISTIPLEADYLLYWYFNMYFPVTSIPSDFQALCSPGWTSLNGSNSKMKQQLLAVPKKAEIIQEGFQEGKSPLTYTRMDIRPIYLKPMQGFLELSYKSGSLLSQSRPQLMLVCATSLAGDHHTPSWQLQ